MKWTKDKPTTPGWYYRRPAIREEWVALWDVTEVVNVRATQFGLVVSTSPESGIFQCAPWMKSSWALDYEWSGPIPTPED